MQSAFHVRNQLFRCLLIAPVLLLLDISQARAADIFCLSPPVVTPPIHACGQAVHVTGFDPHATVRVYAGDEKVGEATPVFSFANIHLTRALQAGELITADQTEPWGETGDTAYSGRSINPVPVTTFSGNLGTPTVDKVIYECGHIVPVDGLVESSNVAVFADAQTDPVGQEDAPEKWIPVFTSALVVNQSITARQTLCAASSATSDGVPVKASPASIPTPKVVTAILGSDQITVTNLLTGALVEVSDVSDAGKVVGGGLRDRRNQLGAAQCLRDRYSIP